jgi:HK97 family phage prohead protease
MSPERLYRVAAATLELRGDGRTVAGIAVPFDQPAEIAEGHRTYTEVFRRGAFAKTIRERGPQSVKFQALHNREKLPLGRASLLREDGAGLYVELRASATRDADEVLTLIKDGALDGLSISFTPVRDRWNTQRTAVERLEAKLHEVSAVPWPAYEGARIMAVRADLAPFGPYLPVDLARRRLALIRNGAHNA